jgi:hypothetical protein
LGLSESEFWELTFRQMRVLSKHRKNELDRQQMFMSVIASVTHNSGMRSTKEPIPLDSFMPQREKTDQEIAEEMAAKLDAFVACQARHR